MNREKTPIFLPLQSVASRLHQQVISNISATSIVSIIHKFSTCSGRDLFSPLAANIQRGTKHSITLSPLEKSHQLCFFIISEIFGSVPDASCLPETSWDSTSKSTEKPGYFHEQHLQGSVSQENWHNCRQIHACQMWNLVSLTLSFIYVLWDTNISPLQIHSHIILASKSGFWWKRCTFRKKSRVYYKREAKALTERQAFPTTESNTEQGFQTNAYTVLKVFLVIVLIPWTA